VKRGGSRCLDGHIIAKQLFEDLQARKRRGLASCLCGFVYRRRGLRFFGSGIDLGPVTVIEEPPTKCGKWRLQLQRQKVQKWPVRPNFFLERPTDKITTNSPPYNRAAITFGLELFHAKEVLVDHLYRPQAAAPKMIVSYDHKMVNENNC
jgi:hypothetical protein